MMRRRADRGIAILTVFMTVLLVLVLVVSMGAISMESLRGVALEAYDGQAYFAAQAGLQEALVQLKASSSWSAGIPTRSLPTLTANTCSVEVTNNHAGGTSVTAGDGTTVPAGFVYLVSTGQVRRSSGSSVLATKKVSSMATDGTVVFGNALMGDTKVEMGGNATADAYNSSQGPYGDATIIPNGAVVATNGTTAESIEMEGSALVKGDLQVGVGGDPAVAISAEGKHYTGSAGALSEAAPVPGVVPPISGSGSSVEVKQGTQTLAPGVYGALTVKNGTVVLSAGDYYFDGSIDVASNGQITVGSGPVRIYVNGNVQVDSGGTLNPNGTPKNLQLYGTTNTSKIKIWSNGDAWLTIYAPQATVDMGGNADLYGAIVASQVEMGGNSYVHYDQAVRSVRGTGTWHLESFRRW